MAWNTNPKAGEMHAMYRDGYSLGQVGVAYGMTRQGVYCLFKYRGWETRRPRKPLPFVVFAGNKYTRRNTGYYGKTKGKRTLLHRDVWEASNGAIPQGWDIHHLDENRENNAVSNMTCLPKSDHTVLHHQMRKRK